MSNFNPQQYWEARLAQNMNVRGVGFLSLGQSFNTWMYRVRAAAFRLALQRNNIAPNSETRVLDIGSGTGFYIALWQTLGARHITGLDIATNAVRTLQKKFPSAHFIHGDVSSGLPVGMQLHSFDLISAMDVLFHIVDDARYEQAIATIAQLLKPNGLFVFSDNFVVQERRSEHHINRTAQTTARLLQKYGLAIEQQRPLFVLMNEPVASSSTVRWWLWKAISRFVRGSEWRGNLLGAVLYPIELLLVRTRRHTQSSKLVVAQKR